MGECACFGGSSHYVQKITQMLCPNICIHRGHCPFALLAEMVEHTYGDARREWPEVELPTPTLVVSYSPATLSSL